MKTENDVYLFIIKSIQWELKTRPMYDCRCDERLKPKDDESTYLGYTLTYTGLPVYVSVSTQCMSLWFILLYLFYFIYYESTKRNLKTKYICGCRCYERLQTKTKEFTCLSYTELVFTGTPKDRDEVNNRDVCECDGWVWELDAIGAPSKLRATRKGATFASSSPHGLFAVNRDCCLL